MRGMHEGTVLLGCDTTSLGNRSPTFRGSVVFRDITLPRNVGIRLASDIVPYPRRRESSKDTLLIAVQLQALLWSKQDLFVAGNNIEMFIPTMSTFRVVSMDDIVFNGRCHLIPHKLESLCVLRRFLFVLAPLLSSRVVKMTHPVGSAELVW